MSVSAEGSAGMVRQRTVGQTYLCGNLALGSDISKYIYENEYNGGVTWEQLQAAFGL